MPRDKCVLRLPSYLKARKSSSPKWGLNSFGYAGSQEGRRTRQTKSHLRSKELLVLGLFWDMSVDTTQRPRVQRMVFCMWTVFLAFLRSCAARLRMSGWLYKLTIPR
jgi:hypothetical protein